MKLHLSRFPSSVAGAGLELLDLAHLGLIEVGPSELVVGAWRHVTQAVWAATPHWATCKIHFPQLPSDSCRAHACRGLALHVQCSAPVGQSVLGNGKSDCDNLDVAGNSHFSRDLPRVARFNSACQGPARLRAVLFPRFWFVKSRGGTSGAGLRQIEIV